MYKKIIIWVIVLILLVTPITPKETQYFYEGDSYTFNPRIDEWYKVEDWELEVCKEWGGTAESYNIDNGPTYLSQTTVTLQAQKSDKLPDNSTMYEVAWYVESGSNVSLTYAVRLKKDSETYRIMAPTEIDANSAGSGYKVEYLFDEYTTVQLAYAVQNAEEKIIVSMPVVDNEGDYYGEGDYGYSTDDGVDWNDDW